ncbi:protein-disulfide reductase DsbD family protein [Algoriphagus resistens]|uniref:protein-disulfide reductase DsbD family protein n=1 Tax=Algoriphagus resistens TaxID=1750590 RepID=UPI0007169B12|nr:cytochrome c biogenesis protein CcdA [Algoriphagus resistens]
MKIWLLISFMFLVTGLQAQIKEVVKWEYQVNKTGTDEYEAVLAAKIDRGWHLYSKDLPPDSGIPTEMRVSSVDLDPIGDLQEIGHKTEEFSEAFGVLIVYYSDSVKFVQKFKLKDIDKTTSIAAEITFQVCNDLVCLAPNTIGFEKQLNAKDEPENSASTVIGNNPVLGSLEDGIKVASLDYKMPLVDCGIEQAAQDSGNGLVFILGLLGGLIALLTPCVFPMIPLTVSYFTKSASETSKGKRNAVVYGSFILVIFLALSIPFHLLDGISGNIFNEISTNVWLNVFFFFVFLFFALSFFGYFEITLPHWLINKSAKAEEAGGVLGIFFMALTLVIVSFSCTGPILGSLLGGVASSSANVPVLLTFALGGFGLAWALVFGFLALFPQVLASLPKSGNWMNSLKVFLGFVEVALALKFLSKADLVSKTFLLKREIFVGIWIVITIGLVLYLIGKIRFPHDSRNQKICPFRKGVALSGVLFIAYLIQGLIPSEKTRLSTLSGILPPLNISLYAGHEDGIYGIQPENDYFKAIQTAKKENKPILLDFTGYGCENCRKMEEFVWGEPDVLPLIRDKLVLASLYIDDREELPAIDQHSVDMGNGQQKKIRTVGDKWSIFQQVNFNNNSQPHYVLVTPDGEVINSPVSGYMSKEKFKEFLECGITYGKNAGI